MEEYIRNPETGRMIKMYGPTYWKLQAKAQKKVAKQLHGCEIFSQGGFVIINPETGALVRRGGALYKRLVKKYCPSWRD